MKPRIAIVGAGGHGRVILDTLRELNSFQVVGFLDDNPKLKEKLINGCPVLGPAKAFATLALRHRLKGIVMGLGDNRLRARFFGDALREGLALPNVIHPKAHLSKRIRVGQGVVIMAGVVVNTDTVIGDNVCINTGATIDHDNILEDHVHIYPGATLAGGVRIGRFTFVGSNATINPYLKVGRDSGVGSGAVVVKDVGDRVIVAGVPARVLRRTNGGKS